MKRVGKRAGWCNDYSNKLCNVGILRLPLVDSQIMSCDLWCHVYFSVQSRTAKAHMFYFFRTSRWISLIFAASSSDWNFQSIEHFPGIFRRKSGDCQNFVQIFSHYRLRAPLIWLCLCSFDRSSNAFMAFSDTARWPFCFFTTQAAASPVSPFLYESTNLHERLINFWMTSFGQASRTWLARSLASAKLFFGCSR